MARWMFTLNLKSFWKEDISTKQKGQEVYKAIQTLIEKVESFGRLSVDDKLYYSSGLEEISEMFNDLSDEEDEAIDEFNYAMRELYDLADTVVPSSSASTAKFCWIKTIL